MRISKPAHKRLSIFLAVVMIVTMLAPMASAATGVTAVSLAASTTTPSVGGSVTLTATATGGSATTKYLFWMDRGGAWNTISDFTTSNTYTVSSLEGGAYVFTVYAQDGDNAPVASQRVYVKVGSTSSVAISGNTATVTATNFTHPMYDWWVQYTDDTWGSVPFSATEPGHFSDTRTSITVPANAKNVVCNVTDGEFFWALTSGDGQWGSALFAGATTATSLSVTSVSAVNSSTLKVSFSGALTTAQKAAAVFAFTRTGTIGAYGMDNANAVWASDNKSVTFQRVGASDLDTGVYTVTVTGIDGCAAPNNTATSTAVTARTVTTIDFVGTTLVKAAGLAPTTATIKYIIKDQYGVDMTSYVTSGLTGLASYASVGVGFNATTGTITVTDANWGAVTAPSTVTLTVAHGATGVTKTATLTLGSATQAGTISVTGIGYYVTTPATTRIIANTANAGYLTISVKDQYNNTLTKYSEINGLLSFATGNANLALTVTDDLGGANADRPAVLNINTTGMTQAASVPVTVMTTSGATASYTIPVVLAAAATTPTLSAPENLIAAGDDENVVVLPLSVTDQFGTALTADQIVAAAGSIVLSSTVPGITSAELSIGTSGATKGKVIFRDADPANVVGAAGSGIITAAIGANTSSQTVEVKAAPYVKTFDFNPSVPASVVNSGSFQYAIKFIDQYGRPMTANGGTGTVTAPAVVPANDANATVTTSLTQTSGLVTVALPGGATLDGAGTNTNAVVNEGPYSGANSTTITAAASGTGTATLLVTLTRTTVDPGTFSLSKSLTILPNSGTGTYAVTDIPTLHAISGADAGVTGADPYAQPINATVDGVSVPSTSIVSVTFTGDKAALFLASAGPQASAFTTQNNKWLVGAANAAAYPAGTSTVTATMNVTISTTNGPVIVTKQVTASSAALSVSNLVVYTGAVTNALTPPTGANAANPLADVVTFADAAGANGGLLAGYLYAVDQYGVYHTATAAKAGTQTFSAQNAAATYAAISVINDPSKLIFSTGDVTLTNGAANFLKGTTGIQYKKATNLAVSIIAGTKSTSATFKVTAIADVTGGAASTQDSIPAAGGTSTITFTRALTSATKTAVQAGIGAAVGGAAASDLSYTWNAANTAVTITNNNAGAAATFAADGTVLAANVTDFFGNTNAGNLSLDLKA